MCGFLKASCPGLLLVTGTMQMLGRLLQEVMKVIRCLLGETRVRALSVGRAASCTVALLFVVIV